MPLSPPVLSPEFCGAIGIRGSRQSEEAWVAVQFGFNAGLHSDHLFCRMILLRIVESAASLKNRIRSRFTGGKNASPTVDLGEAERGGALHAPKLDGAPYGVDLQK